MKRVVIAGGLLVALARPALAGMPMVVLSDVASLRLRAISFFLLVLLLSAKGVQKLWNSLRTDFPSMPEISYKRALGLVALWGALFLLVLTMISGARELLTPGAWRKDGATYKLAPEDEKAMLRAAREDHLAALRAELWRYAKDHEKKLPPHEFVPEIGERAWTLLGTSGMRYVYIAGRVADGEGIVAYEPGVVGADRLVLYADGSIKEKPVHEIKQELRVSR